MRKKITSLLSKVGPGIVMAATGVGAGDLIAATVSGARFGTAILWAVIIGVMIKFAITESLARWQLATGSTALEGWIARLPRAVSLYFFAYLLLWSFIVAGALISATGLAAHALFPGLSVAQWGVIHSLTALALVWFGGYRQLETIMKVVIALMFLVVMLCAALLTPNVGELVRGLVIPTLPKGSIVFVFGVIGGVGGSVTLLSYGYWIRERQWNRAEHLELSRTDLAVAYTLTGLFGIAAMIIAAGVQPGDVTGNQMVLSVAEHLETVVGPVGKWCFLIGFWGAVFSSMLGVWQGIPYLFNDFVINIRRKENAQISDEINTRSPLYRGYLLYLALPPMTLLLAGKPVWVVVAYTITGAVFMPFLAALLLYMNNRRDWVAEFVNRWPANTLLTLSIFLFGYLLVVKLVDII